MTPSSADALEFLQRFAPDGPWVLEAFAPDRDTPLHGHFQNNQPDSLGQWVDKHGKKNANQYFLLGVPTERTTKKPLKEQMRGARYAWVDLDPNERNDLDAERALILSKLTTNLPPDVPPPTIIVDSGRGYWAMWRLQDFCLEHDLLERCNRGLAAKFGKEHADHCHNIDRIARLPGTINSKTGRKARVVEWHDERFYALGDLPIAEPETTSATARVDIDISNAPRLQTLDDLNKWGVTDRVKRVIANGRDGEPKDGDDSRSAWLFDAVCNLLRRQVPDAVVFGIITDRQWPISDSVFTQKNGRAVPSPEKYALKQLEDAKRQVALDASDFIRGEKGLIVRESQHNIRVALAQLGVRVRHDLFKDRLLIAGLADTGPLLDDRSMERLWLLVDERFQFRPSKEFFWVVVSDTARRDSFHPVRDYLAGLQWDGRARLDTWLKTYGGADDTPFIRAVSSITLIGAVRRVRRPGCKFDEMLVLESAQGTNKSTALQVLAVNEDWFSDELPLNADSKRVIESLTGRWIVEAAELRGMRRGDVEHVKALLSRQTDRARLSYDRLTSEVPRQCIIVGTTNNDRYLRDNTGHRRFWPVAVKQFDLAALRRDRDQLWAEAAAREAAGESTRLDPKLYSDAAVVQEERRVHDPFVDMLARALGDSVGKLTCADAFDVVGVPPGMRTQDHSVRVGDAMRELGWHRKKLRVEGHPTWVYAKGDVADQQFKRLRVFRGPDGDVRVGDSAAREVF